MKHANNQIVQPYCKKTTKYEYEKRPQSEIRNQESGISNPAEKGPYLPTNLIQPIFKTMVIIYYDLTRRFIWL